MTWVSLGNLLISLFFTLFDRTLFDMEVEALFSSLRHCLAALALPKIEYKGRHLEVELEVEGRVSGDKWVKAGSLGNKGRPSCECLWMWFSQAEVLNHCILGLSLPLQYKQAKATLRWSQRIWVQAAAFCKNIWVQSVNWHL